MIEFECKHSLVLAHAKLKQYSTMRVGGTARYLFEIGCVEELAYILSRCKNFGIPTIVLGNGSNTLCSDCGFEGGVLHFGERFRRVELLSEECVRVESGKTIPALCRDLQKYGLSGLEFACGIPGSVGGGTVMNCGAFGGEMGTLVKSVEFFSGKSFVMNGTDCAFSYRESFFKHNLDCQITAVTLRLKRADPSDILRKMEEVRAQRTHTQGVTFPSLGSVFLRLEGQLPPAKLIDLCGLKGIRIGDAAVSDQHAGYIVNLGNATSENIISLIALIKSTVEEKYGILLHEEIRMI